MASTFIIPKQMVADKAKLILKSNANQFIKPRFFKVDVDNMELEQNELELAAIESPLKAFGIPIFDAINIPGFNYTDPRTGNNVGVEEIYMNTALIEVNRPKVIVETQVQGRNGTVNEYICDGNYEITITGAVIGKHSNVPPRDEIFRLMEVINAPVSIKIYSNFLDYFQIYTVIIKDHKFTQIEGTRNAVSFTLNCISEEPFEIQYNENQAINKKMTASF